VSAEAHEADIMGGIKNRPTPGGFFLADAKRGWR
jgi:hypothetical protein